jgi:hypothetical protein
MKHPLALSIEPGLIVMLEAAAKRRGQSRQAYIADSLYSVLHWEARGTCPPLIAHPQMPGERSPKAEKGYALQRQPQGMAWVRVDEAGFIVESAP